MDMIFLWPTWTTIAVLLGVMMLANEIGFRAGRSLHREEPETSRTVSNALKGSIFGLVAFLLAFSFSMTSSRHDARRRTVLDEANAVGTCYLRASLLGEPYRTKIRGDLRQFVDVRLDYFQNGLEPIEVADDSQRMNELLDQIWASVEAAFRNDPQQVHTSQIIPAVNDVVDLNSTRAWIATSHIQPIVLLLLILCVVVSSLLIGHSSGQARRRHLGLWAAFNVLFALVFFVLLDFDRPRRGLIQVDHSPLIELQQTMDPGPPAIPLPTDAP